MNKMDAEIQLHMSNISTTDALSSYLKLEEAVRNINTQLSLTIHEAANMKINEMYHAEAYRLLQSDGIHVFKTVYPEYINASCDGCIKLLMSKMAYYQQCKMERIKWLLANYKPSS